MHLACGDPGAGVPARSTMGRSTRIRGSGSSVRRASATPRAVRPPLMPSVKPACARLQVGRRNKKAGALVDAGPRYPRTSLFNLRTAPSPTPAPPSSMSATPPPTSMKLPRSLASALARRCSWAAKPVPAGIRRPDDDVFLQAAQIVLEATNRRFGEHARGFLERRRRDERLGRQRSLGDAEQHGLQRRRGLLVVGQASRSSGWRARDRAVSPLR